MVPVVETQTKVLLCLCGATRDDVCCCPTPIQEEAERGYDYA